VSLLSYQTDFTFFLDKKSKQKNQEKNKLPSLFPSLARIFFRPSRLSRLHRDFGCSLLIFIPYFLFGVYLFALCPDFWNFRRLADPFWIAWQAGVRLTTFSSPLS
jgi:hypothetical protein